jgi:hypothetical protein
MVITWARGKYLGAATAPTAVSAITAQATTAATPLKYLSRIVNLLKRQGIDISPLPTRGTTVAVRSVRHS